MTRYLFAVGLLTLASCAILDPAPVWHAPMPVPAAEQAPPASTAPRKVKGNYTVVYQVAGPGATLSADASQPDNRKQGQRGGAGTSGNGSPASARTERGGVAWYVWLLVAAIGAAAWEWLSSKLPLGWLRWRKGVG